jgi:hypothetical protein
MLQVERERFEASICICLNSSESAVINSLYFWSIVDLRADAFTISFVNTRFEKMPRLMERARDHLSMLTETVRLVRVLLCDPVLGSSRSELVRENVKATAG